MPEGPVRRGRKWFLPAPCGLAAALIALGGAGCRPARPGPAAQPVPVDIPEAPKGAAIADPVLREARDQADAMLRDLIAGKFEDDPDLSPLSKKLKGYQDGSIRSQEMLREDTAQFGGVLTAPGSRARFTMTLVKQANGTWAVGAFSGPDRQ